MLTVHETYEWMISCLMHQKLLDSWQHDSRHVIGDEHDYSCLHVDRMGSGVRAVKSNITSVTTSCTPDNLVRRLELSL